MKQEIQLVASRLNIKPELVKCVIDNLFKSLKEEYLTKPIHSKKGVLLQGLGQFYIPPENVRSFIMKFETNSFYYKTKFTTDKKNLIEAKQLYKNLTK